MKIRYLKEGVNKIIDILTYSHEYSNAKTSKEQQLIFDSFIKQMDPKNLTYKFRDTILELLEEGLNKNDPFLKWLEKSDDSNIKILDDDSAQTLKNLLKNKKLDPNSNYIIDKNNLFSGSSKDISYKLNALSMLLDPKIASKYKNSKGESPSINLVYVEDHFLNPTLKFKRALEDFVSDDSNEESEEKISYIVWAQIVAKISKGKEWAYLKKQISSYLRGDKHKEIRTSVLSDIDKLIKYFPDKLKKLGSFEVPKNASSKEVVKIMIEAIQDKSYNVVKGATIFQAIKANLPENFKEEDIKKPEILSNILSNILEKSGQKDLIYKIKILISNNSLIQSYLESTIKNATLKTLIESTIKFLNEYINIK